MSVKTGEIVHCMEKIAPIRLAEDWDNVGLIIGSYGREVKRVLLCLDVTSGIVSEAIEIHAELIISHHPFIFKGIKRIIEEDAKGRLICELIRNGIGVYSSHTNIDMADGGVNSYLADLLGLKNVELLKAEKSEKLYKLVVFVPEEYASVVREAICRGGAGHIGKYSDCSFSVNGEGMFRPLEGADPFIGSAGKLEKVKEIRIETVVPQAYLGRTIELMLKAHPYEEAAYDVYPLEIPSKSFGYARVGTLPEAVTIEKFIEIIKSSLKINDVRLIGCTNKDIKKVAVFSGSFDESIMPLLNNRADILVTGDVKHHNAVDAVENGLCIVDAGHYATERIFIPYLAQNLRKEFNGIEFIASSKEESPFKYC